jgi:hypothetical protein
VIYVFGKALVMSGISQHVTKHVIRDLVNQGEDVRAIWRGEFVFDPELVDPAFRDVLQQAGSADPKLPDRCVKCGLIDDVLMDGLDQGAPTDAVLAPLGEVIPEAARFSLDQFNEVFVTYQPDAERLREALGLKNVAVWPMPPYVPAAAGRAERAPARPARTVKPSLRARVIDRAVGVMSDVVSPHLHHAKALWRRLGL